MQAIWSAQLSQKTGVIYKVPLIIEHIFCKDCSVTAESDKTD